MVSATPAQLHLVQMMPVVTPEQLHWPFSATGHCHQEQQLKPVGFFCCTVEWKLQDNMFEAGNYALGGKGSSQLSGSGYLCGTQSWMKTLVINSQILKGTPNLGSICLSWVRWGSAQWNEVLEDGPKWMEGIDTRDMQCMCHLMCICSQQTTLRV